jgi:hypothetical protein
MPAIDVSEFQLRRNASPPIVVDLMFASTRPPAVNVVASVPIEYPRGAVPDDVRYSSVIQ